MPSEYAHSYGLRRNASGMVELESLESRPEPLNALIKRQYKQVWMQAPYPGYTAPLSYPGTTYPSFCTTCRYASHTPNRDWDRLTVSHLRADPVE